MSKATLSMTVEQYNAESTAIKAAVDPGYRAMVALRERGQPVYERQGGAIRRTRTSSLVTAERGESLDSFARRIAAS